MLDIVHYLRYIRYIISGVGCTLVIWWLELLFWELLWQWLV